MGTEKGRSKSSTVMQSLIKGKARGEKRLLQLIDENTKPISRSMAHLVASPTSSPRYLTRRAAKMSKSMNDLLVMWLSWVIISSFICVPFQCISIHGCGRSWKWPKMTIKAACLAIWWCIYSIHVVGLELSVIWSVVSYFLANSKPLQSNYHAQCVQMKNCQFPSGALLYITKRLKAPICTCCQMNQTHEKVFTFQSSLSITALNGFHNLCKSFGCSPGKLT